MAYKLLAFDDHGVSGVVSALKAHHDIGIFGQKIDEFAFAFITPLGSYNYDICHLSLLVFLFTARFARDAEGAEGFYLLLNF
jgi:hypothetical protein